MTRINVIPAIELDRLHLIAEYRELPRIFGLVRKAIERGEQPDLFAIPAYTLGKGHVRFFYPRLAWLTQRQASLVIEMKARNYAPQHTGCLFTAFNDIPKEWWNEWSPCETALAINRARIAKRL